MQIKIDEKTFNNCKKNENKTAIKTKRQEKSGPK